MSVVSIRIIRMSTDMGTANAKQQYPYYKSIMSDLTHCHPDESTGYCEFANMIIWRYVRYAVP